MNARAYVDLHGAVRDDRARELGADAFASLGVTVTAEFEVVRINCQGAPPVTRVWTTLHVPAKPRNRRKAKR